MRCLLICLAQNYVVDLFVDFASMRILVIDVGPFGRETSTGLFSWRADETLLRRGPAQGTFELRVCSFLQIEPYQVLPVYWKRYLRSKREARHRRCVIT